MLMHPQPPVLYSPSLLSRFFSLSRSTKLPHLFLPPPLCPPSPLPPTPISAHPVFAGAPGGWNPSLRRRITNRPRQSPALVSLLRSLLGSEVRLVAWKSISRPLVPSFSQSERQKYTSRTRRAVQSADGIAGSFSSRGGEGVQGIIANAEQAITAAGAVTLFSAGWEEK